MTATDVALLVFSTVNALRLLAYVPQIVQIARDKTGAAAISNVSWVLFAVSHLSTAAYAGVVLADATLVLAFVANACCCLGVIGMTVYKRQRWARGGRGEVPAPPAAA